MNGINRVIIVGTVGQDPDIRAMPSGEYVANFSVATSEQWKDKQGQKQESTEWHKIVIFGKLAEIVHQYVTKGTKLYLEGKLKTRSWEQDGVKRYATEIVCNQMQMLGGNQDNKQSSPQGKPEHRQAQEFQAPDDDFSDSIPF